MIKKICSYVTFLGLFLTTAIATSEVYDCFMFFNEIELLKMRLEELDEVVDYFVLVESAETQRGDPKPFYFYENRHLFEKYLDKIIHIMVNERHPEMGLWEREHFQRECIARALIHCDSSDMILISDLDEIPRSELIQGLSLTIPKRNARLLQAGKLKKFKKHNKHKNILSNEEKLFYMNGARGFEMRISFYHLNRQSNFGRSCANAPWVGAPPPSEPWVGTVATTYSMLTKFGVQYFRETRWRFPKIYNGGWHFTWMGGKERIKKKFASIVEGDPNGESIPDEEIDRWINMHPVVPIDETFPKYVLRNLDYLKSIGYIAEYESP